MKNLSCLLFHDRRVPGMEQAKHHLSNQDSEATQEGKPKVSGEAPSASQKSPSLDQTNTTECEEWNRIRNIILLKASKGFLIQETQELGK